MPGPKGYTGGRRRSKEGGRRHIRRSRTEKQKRNKQRGGNLGVRASEGSVPPACIYIQHPYSGEVKVDGTDARMYVAIQAICLPLLGWQGWADPIV